MSIRFYCDVCDKEMPAIERDSLQLQYGQVKVKVIATYLDRIGDVCHACIKGAVANGHYYENNGEK